MTKYFFSTAAELLFVIVFFHCAGQAPPSGGLSDTTPPEIIESYPLANTLHFNDRRIVLKFSEYVDRSSVEQSMFFSPPVGTLSFDWGGTDVEITFSDSLRQNTTYIMTVGTDVIDRRNHNRMVSAFALPFSTGEHIDSAGIAGKVFGTLPDGIMIFAYKLDGIQPDTLNPTHTKPYYLTQTGKDGTFKLTNIALGSYRLIAVRDQFKNLIYDPQIDEFGITHNNTRVSRDSMFISGVYFRMAKEDTSSPFLSSARSIDRSHALLRFSESIDSSSISANNISIVDTVRGASLGLIDISFVERSLADLQLVTSQQESSAAYRVTISDVRDLHGNPINRESRSAVFITATVQDTTKPTAQLLGIQDSARNIQVDDSLQFSFSEAVQRTVFEHGCTFTNAQSSKIGGNFVWTGSTSVLFVPSKALDFGKWYAVNVDLDSLKDIMGNGYHDSVWVRRFQMVQEKSLGSIAGVVHDEVQSKSPILVTASEISNKNIKSRQTVADSAGAFRFEYLPEGRYTLFAFRDADSNGVYSFGTPFPYRPSERFSALSDTLKVRARWPLEGIVVKIQ